MSKFADDIELGGAIASTEGGEALHSAVDKTENWESTNHIKHNKNKFLNLHLGRRNPAHTH